MPAPSTPPISADVITEVGDSVVLIERKNPPPGWAIPGGFVDHGESIEQAAMREMREEIGLDVELMSMLGVYSAPDRDPRGQTITTVFIGRAGHQPQAGDDASAAFLVPISELADHYCRLAFDHAVVLADYIRFRETGVRPSPKEMLNRLKNA
ncbi:MAG: NUDIX hydrolase [Leptospiraceae bacterium]|nr:NUDIX hydrolase [Leptospiraceae bacterium]